jgi:hypothetical protein
MSVWRNLPACFLSRFCCFYKQSNLARVASSCLSNEFWALSSFFQARSDNDILVQQQQLKQVHLLQRLEIINLMYCLFKQA